MMLLVTGGTKPTYIQWLRVIIVVCLNVIGRITLRTDPRILKAIGYLLVRPPFLWVLAPPLTQILRWLTIATRTVIGTDALNVLRSMRRYICLSAGFAFVQMPVSHLLVLVVFSERLFSPALEACFLVGVHAHLS